MYLKQIVFNPLFISIFFVKVIVCFFLDSLLIENLFQVFINYFFESDFSNPYLYFFSLNQIDYFPYPALMLWVVSFPKVLLSGLDVNISIKLVLLFFDVLCLICLVKLRQNCLTKLLWLYWASPVVFFINYIHGQLDIIPIVFFISFHFIYSYK